MQDILEKFFSASGFVAFESIDLFVNLCLLLCIGVLLVENEAGFEDGLYPPHNGEGVMLSTAI